MPRSTMLFKGSLIVALSLFSFAASAEDILKDEAAFTDHVGLPPSRRAGGCLPRPHLRGREPWCSALATLAVNTRIDKRWTVHLPEYSMIACDRRFSFSGDPKMVPSGGFWYVSILR